MNASSKNSAADSPSETKPAFDDERYSTLPKPSGVEVQNTLPEGSVMWDGPSSSGEGARSAVPAHQGTSPSYAAGAVTNSPTAVREVNLVAASATPDAQHKTVETTHAKPSASSSKNSFSDRESANDAVFVSETNSAAQTKSILEQIQASPLAVREHLHALHDWIEQYRPVFEMNSVAQAMHKVSSGGPSADAAAERLVEHASEVLAELEQRRTLRMDTNPSQETLRGYQKDIAYLTKQRAAFIGKELSPWFEVLAQFGLRKSTYNTYRAALTWWVTAQLKGLMQTCKSYDLNHSPGSWRAVLGPEIGSKLLELVSIRGLTYERMHGWLDMPNKSSLSRKHDLRFLRDGWLDRLVECCETSPIYGMASVLLRFGGMRPKELENGVVVRRAGEYIAVAIKGAKVRATAGQPLRGFVLHASSMPQWFLDGLPQGQEVTVQIDKDGFRSYLSSLTKRVLQGAKRSNASEINLSAVLVRHAVATELRRNYWASVDIAKVLGHVSDATSRGYGELSTGSKKAKPVAVVEKSARTARPVKVTDKSGLDKVLSQKAQKNNKGSKRKRR